MSQQKVKNPFVHSHDDDHDHHHHHHHDDGEDLTQLDPAQQSLADALRVSFTILKFLMLGLLIAYFFSGVFRVMEQEEAVRLRFGQIVGDVYDTGWHMGLPYPIEEKIHVPVAERDVQITDAYWYQLDEQMAAQIQESPEMAGPLDPEQDGSLVTADANIVHGRFSVNYRIHDTHAFVRNVGLSRRGAVLSDGSVARGPMDGADVLVRSVAEQGVVYAVAQTLADDVARGRFNAEAAQRRMQDILTDLESGIVVTSVTMDDRAMPLPVQRAYQAVVEAESERGRLVNEARDERTQILTELAGAGHEPLLELVGAFELSHAAGETDQASELEQQLNEALGTLRIAGPDGAALRIGGEVAGRINAARTDRTTTVQQMRTEVTTFQSLLASYEANPRLQMTLLWQDAKEQIFTGDVETFYTMGGHFYPVVHRDREIARQREIERRQQQQDGN